MVTGSEVRRARGGEALPVGVPDLQDEEYVLRG